jgi:hypothetical protein
MGINQPSPQFTPSDWRERIKFPQKLKLSFWPSFSPYAADETFSNFDHLIGVAPWAV